MQLNIEVLISTINRTDFDFLHNMFQYNDLKDFKILIVNQTSEDKQLLSSFKNVRVFNCFEYGVPKSRNCAIKNAVGDICLMADDDTVYQFGLKQTILDAYEKYQNVDMISFEAIDEENNLHTKYSEEGFHNKKNLKNIYTWVITFKRNSYINNNICYNNHFGFGSAFKGCEEYVFLRNAFDKKLKMYHVAKTIVMHPFESSGRFMGSDNAIFANTAMTHRFYGNLSYFWLLKYVIYMWKDDYITFSEIPRKFRIGLKGISKYKALKASGEIDKIYVN
jgi:hypothetical protein